MIAFRCVFNGKLPPFDLLRPYRPEDFEGLPQALHPADGAEADERFWASFSIGRRDDLGDLR